MKGKKGTHWNCIELEIFEVHFPSHFKCRNQRFLLDFSELYDHYASLVLELKDFFFFKEIIMGKRNRGTGNTPKESELRDQAYLICNIEWI